MALEPVQLDTLNWEQMVAAIRTRIIADSRGQWTLHAPVDPGVTLLELFAWLLDQRIYWMEQVPDSLTRAILALLGHSPHPARAAGTVLQFNSPSDVLTISAGTAMRLGDLNPPIIFSTDQDLTVLPLANRNAIGASRRNPMVSLDGIDHTTDLSQKRPVPLLAAGKTSGEVRITFILDKKIAAHVSGQFFSLMFELDTPPDIHPQWTSEAASDLPPPATLKWSYPNAPGDKYVPFPANKVAEGTGGLRRSGVVRLPLMQDWLANPIPGAATFSCVIRLQIENATYTVVPRLLRLLPNVVQAHHRWRRTKHPSTKDWLPLPGNTISLPDARNSSSLQEYPPIEDSVKLSVLEKRDGQQEWQSVSDFSFSGPDSRVFLVDRPRSKIFFGDGFTGRLPVVASPDGSDIQVDYQAGGGVAGNVGQGLDWWAIGSDIPRQIGATNVVPGEGGKDSETLEAALLRAQAVLKERNRAVSKEDYENLAQTTPGVALRRAYAAIGYHPLFPCVTMPGVVAVFVVPDAPRAAAGQDVAKEFFVPAPLPDDGALQAARDRLAAARLAGSEVFVEPAAYRSVWLSLDIATDSLVSADLRRQIAKRLEEYLDPLVGGVEGKGWPFGDPLRPSSLLREAQTVLGTAGDVIRVSVRLEGEKAESCSDVKIRPYELLKLEDVSLNFQQRTSSSGGLR